MSTAAVTVAPSRASAPARRAAAWAGSPVTWIVAGVALTLALRLPFFDAALGRDEGGDALVALAWNHSGPFAYGPYLLDRPPLLVAFFRLAATTGGDTGVRALGAVAASAAVVLTTLLAVRVGGRRAAPFAALIIAVGVSSFAAMAVYTPGELIAIVPSTASLLLLVTALRRPSGGLLTLAGAGALAAVALLVKQSFGDALVAGLVGIAATAIVAPVPRRKLVARAAAYVGGFAGVGAALVAWAALAGASAHAVWYAIVGFRLDSASALANATLGEHFSRLTNPTLRSGLALALILAVAGIALLRTRPGIRPALAAWLLAGVIGVTLGGSYWPHYVIELMPVAAVGAALLLARRPRVGALALCLVALPAAAFTLRPVLHDQSDQYQQDAVTVGNYVRLRAEPGQTAYVMYARVNALYYTRLPSPYPYHWALMLRAAPHVQSRLRALLASPRRPTWVIAWQPFRSFGLDRSGATRRLVAANYRRVGRVCGHSVLLARGAQAKPPPPMSGPCRLSPTVLKPPA